MKVLGKKQVVSCLLLILFLSVFVGYNFQNASAAPTVGANIRVTNLSSNQNEPSVAVNPTNTQKLAVGYNDYSSGGACRLSWSWSDNQGSTWTRGGIFSVSGYSRGGNPIVAFDSAGNCYYAGMVYNPYTTSSGTFSQDGSIFLAKSNDGGHTFSVFQKTVRAGSGVNPSLDRPWMYINPANNYIFLAWTRRDNAWAAYPNQDMTIWLTRSTDGGVTFSNPIQIGSDLPPASDPYADRCHGVQIATGAGNTVYVSWHTSETGTRGTSDWKPPKIWISQSTDGGVTFGASNLVATKQNSKPALFISMATDPASGRIYIAYCERPTSSGDLDIYVATATAVAGPWTIKRVNDDTVGNGVDQWYPVLDVAPNGRVDAIWYDYRAGSSNRHVYYSASSDRGTTWEANTRVTDTYGPAATYAGDYVGCIASQNDRAIAVWGDTRISADNQEVYSAVLSMPPAPSDIIVDDVNANFVGTWTSSSTISGYYGSGYRYHAAGTGANTATWSFNIPTAGSWQVYARWTSGSDRATNAKYTIYHASGSTLVQVNQEINGGSWQYLGTYSFNVGAYSVRLSDNANEIVIADAIRLVSSSATYSLKVNVVGSGSVTKSPDQPSYASGIVVTLTASPEAGCVFNGWSGALTGNANPATITMNGAKTVAATFTTLPSEIIVDDVNAVFVGTWTSSSSPSGYFGSGYRYHTSGTGANTATWSFNIPTAGSWQVFARWTSGTNRATMAKYTVNYAGGSTVVQVNQQTNGGVWFSLGVFSFNVGTRSVVLSDNADGYVVIADAVKLVPRAAAAHIYIEHTYRGDLVVDIGVGNTASPIWSSRVSNRQGGSADNLDLTVDLSAATAYLPPSNTYRWFLRVYDAVAGDQGRITQFTIVYQGITYTSTDVPVPVNDLKISYAYIPSVAQAHIYIQHTYRGDLIVDIGVGSTSSPLWIKRVWNGTGGSLDNLDLYIDLSSVVKYLPPSTTYTWVVKVYDRAVGDTGKIVTFTITYQGKTYTSPNVPMTISDLKTSYTYIRG